MMFSKSLSVFLLLLASATADVSPSSRNGRGSSSLMLRNRFLAEDEEASAESAEAAESVETEEESVESASEEEDSKESRRSSSSAPEERECEIGEYMCRCHQRRYLMPPTSVMLYCAVP